MARNKNDTRLSAASFSNISSDRKEAPTSSNLFSAVSSLVSKPWALRRLLAVMALGFGIGMVYYGMPLALGSLPFNLYLSVTLNALSEFPASATTYLLMAKADRKASILLLTISSGILSTVSVLGSLEGLRIGLEVGSFFAACVAANMLLIFTVELFPTAVRNSAVSAVRQAKVLGGVVAPLLAAAGRGGQGAISFGVFGAAIGLSGVFVFFLPETRGKALSDTMDDEERKGDAKAGVYGSAV